MRKISLLTAFILFSSFTTAKESLLKNAYGLPYDIVKELREMVSLAGENNVTVSSKQRTVKQQIEVMFDYYITCEKITDLEQKSKCGIELAKNVYHSDCHAAFDVYDSRASRNANVVVMTKALTESLVKLGSNRHCMNHVELPQIYTPIIAVDLKPSSIKDLARFYDVVKRNNKVVQFYYPDIEGRPKSQVQDSAFHLGFLRQ